MTTSKKRSNTKLPKLFAKLGLISLLLCVISNSYSQAPASDATTQTTAEPAPPTQAAVQERAKPNSEAEILTLLTHEVEAGEIHWLGTQQTFLALWQPDKTGAPFGATILLHGDGQTADWPNTVNALRNNLALHGWATLSISMPAADKPDIPARPEKLTPLAQDNADDTAAPAETTAPQAMPNDTAPMSQAEQVRNRIDAAIDFLKEKGQYNIVIIAHGSSGVLATQYIDEASGDAQKMNMKASNAKITRPIRALVLVAPRNQSSGHTDDITAFLADPGLPVLDIYYDNHLLDPLERKKRMNTARSRKFEHYYQIKLLRPTDTNSDHENRLTRRVRGFLNKHAKGVEVTR